MTAHVVELRPWGDQADEIIRRTVRALMKGNGLNVETLAPLVSMSAATLYRRLAEKGKGREFKASEVADIARHFDVTVASLYDGLGGTFIPPSGPASLPRLDSNQQPSGSRFLQVAASPMAA
jgi:hypothetical protein